MKKTIFLGLFIALSVPFVSFAAFDSNLKYGATGPAVKEMQEFLVDHGVCTITPSGNFFALTLSCVKSFQTKEGISPVSGYWGPLTRAKASAKLDLTASDTDELASTGTVTAPTADSDFQKLLAMFTAMKAAQDTQAAATQQIAVNTTPAPEPVSKKELIVTAIPRMSDYYNRSASTECTKFFSASVLDDSGKVVANPDFVMTSVKRPYSIYHFGRGSGTAYDESVYCFVNGITEDTLIFSYEPLGLSKTITVTK